MPMANSIFVAREGQKVALEVEFGLFLIIIQIIILCVKFVFGVNNTIIA